MNRSMTLMVGIVVSAVLLALGSVSIARAQDVYGACSRNKNGVEKMRAGSLVVNQSPLCKVTETARTWNQEGPQGQQGIPGFSSCTPEEFTGTTNANTFAVLNATCSSGKAVGASAIWHTPFDAADNGPFYFFMRTGTTWTIIPYNHTGTSQDFRFQLQCCQ